MDRLLTHAPQSSEHVISVDTLFDSVQQTPFKLHLLFAKKKLLLGQKTPLYNSCVAPNGKTLDSLSFFRNPWVCCEHDFEAAGISWVQAQWRGKHL